MAWSLHTTEGDHLEPRTFSTGKTQEDIVQDVLRAVKEGHKVIFLHGRCGTGKSAVALNVAKELGRASVVVPVKYLQHQYEEDYTKKKVIKKADGTPLKITLLTGRNNHKCLYNASCMADDRLLPCSIDIRKDNLDLMRLYVKENPFVDEEDFEDIDDFRRMSVAPACPHWSPIMANEWLSGSPLPDVKAKKEYLGLRNKRFTLLKREPGCTYYEQFSSYTEADVIVFNAKKYELEVLMDRKPATDVEIIDECDEFLDSLGNEKRVNLSWMEKRLSDLAKNCKYEDRAVVLTELLSAASSLLGSRWLDEMIQHKEVLTLQETKMAEILRIFLAHEELLEYEELEQYYIVAKNFDGMFDSTYTSFERTAKDQVIVNIVNVNLKKKLAEFLDRNKVFVMMSGTIHSAKVLKNIFGITDFVVIEAETSHQGKAIPIFTKKEKNFRYKEFSSGRVTREDYLRALEAAIAVAKPPMLVHVNGYNDLPSEEEKGKYDLSIMSKEKLLEQQETYKHGELLQWFKEGKLKILYSTKCSRGVDLPGEQCNSIIFTKYPYPAAESLFWKVLKRSNPDDFMEFYMDKAYREFLQRIYRGLRSKDDKVFILSPDLKVLKTHVS